jgi:hypothetical protein
MKTLLVYRDARQYVSRIVGDTILWTHDAALALPMTCTQATALAERLQRSADMAGPNTQPAGEYGVQPLGVQEIVP